MTMFCCFCFHFIFHFVCFLLNYCLTITQNHSNFENLLVLSHIYYWYLLNWAKWSRNKYMHRGWGVYFLGSLSLSQNTVWVHRTKKLPSSCHNYCEPYLHSSLSLICMPMTSENNANLTPIHVNSFNVNGLGQEAKWNAIFKKLKQNNSIVLLQETHSTFQIERKSGNRNLVWRSFSRIVHPQVGGLLSYFQEIWNMKSWKNIKIVTEDSSL